MTAYVPTIGEKRLDWIDSVTLTAERGFRTAQGVVGLLTLAGLGTRSFQLLGTTLSVAQIGEKVVFGRMAVLAMEVFKTAGALCYKNTLTDARPKDAKDKAQYGTLNNATDLSFIVVDVSLFLYFATEHVNWIAPNKVTDFIGRASTPALTLGFVGLVVKFKADRDDLKRQLEVENRKSPLDTNKIAELEGKIESKTRSLHKFYVDLLFNLAPVQADGLLLEGEEWQHVGNVVTGIFGGWSTYMNRDYSLSNLFESKAP